MIAPPDGNLRDYLATLDRLRRMGITVLVPGHGAPNRGVARMLDALIEHRRMRERKILRTLQSGPITEDELCRRAYDDSPAADLALAGKTLRAHLDKLEEEGRVISARTGWSDHLAPRPNPAPGPTMIPLGGISDGTGGPLFLPSSGTKLGTEETAGRPARPRRGSTPHPEEHHGRPDRLGSSQDRAS